MSDETKQPEILNPVDAHECIYCGIEYDPKKSIANDPDSYCSIDCETADMDSDDEDNELDEAEDEEEYDEEIPDLGVD